jgi:hypothetical protein
MSEATSFDGAAESDKVACVTARRVKTVYTGLPRQDCAYGEADPRSYTI